MYIVLYTPTFKNLIDKLDFASVDVSFISLKLIIPVMKTLLAENAEAVCLIKPQFEAGREQVGKKGVVKDRSVHVKVVEGILDFIINDCGMTVLNLDYSPIKGPQGNIEYLVHILNNNIGENRASTTAIDVVTSSHEQLDKKE